VAQSAHFIPVIIKLPEPLDLNVTKVKLTYEASDPDGVTRKGAGTAADASDPYIYTPANGTIRIWSKDGDTVRAKASLNAGGDYVKSGEKYETNHLGIQLSDRTWKFFIEAVNASNTLADQVITIEIDPDGNGPTPYMCQDFVRFTALKTELHQDNIVKEVGEIVFISQVPEMPNLTVRLRPELENLMVRWRLHVFYHEGNRNDDDYFPGQNTWQSLSGNQMWNIGEELEDMFIGGKGILTYKIDEFQAQPMEELQVRRTFKLWGRNATQATVRTVATELRHQLVAWKEGRFQQFRYKPQHVIQNFAEGPFPVLHTFDNGFGIMQLTSGNIPKEQLWNWRQNVLEGISRLQGFTNNAQTYNNQVQQGLAWDNQTGGNPPNEGVAYPNAPEFNDDQLDRETWARYNTGYRYYDYDPNANAWVTRQFNNPAGINYANDLANRRDNINNNNQYPPLWGGN
jgi:hypothetical protein